MTLAPVFVKVLSASPQEQTFPPNPVPVFSVSWMLRAAFGKAIGKVIAPGEDDVDAELLPHCSINPSGVRRHPEFRFIEPDLVQ
ncbi:hypothetical protein AAH392_004716 [Citrobacter koseri]|nr:hypothetical protein [Citrobacter koseri]HAT3724599.1 hypothetical protein [Citrobacter koseri]HEM8507856.1 hypothetical protein [Citrobacter koseri]HEM8574539.1 hypothetical protein [Citrobacter koseri]